MQQHDCFKSLSNSVEIESGVVGNPFANLLIDNGHIEVHFCNVHAKHNVIHPVILKFFDEEVKMKILFFMTVQYFIYFMNTNEKESCTMHIPIIKAWDHGLNGQ